MQHDLVSITEIWRSDHMQTFCLAFLALLMRSDAFFVLSAYGEIWVLVVLLASVLQNLSVKSPVGLPRFKSITRLNKTPCSDLMFRVISSDFSPCCLLSEDK